jgi:serine/threonine protein phosphatase PrpC
MLLYTDGLVEAIDERGEMFGEGRLEAAFAKTASKSPKECLSALVAAVVAFRDRNAHRDDITAVVIRANSPRRRALMTRFKVLVVDDEPFICSRSRSSSARKTTRSTRPETARRAWRRSGPTSRTSSSST